MNKSIRELLVRGGLGSSAFVALMIGGVACGEGTERVDTEREETERESIEPSTSRDVEEPVTSLPSPSLDTELTSVHQPSLPPAPGIEVEPAVEPDPYAPTIDENAPVGVRRIVITSGIESREPVDTTDELVLGQHERIYAFVEALNHTDEEGALDVTFEPESGEVTGHVTLNIPANTTRWRTWAFTRHVYTPGRWRVVVRDNAGTVVAERAFEVVE